MTEWVKSNHSTEDRMNDGALTLKSYGVGAVKTWVHIPAAYLGAKE